jgi:zinc transport system substrate-binding protein
MEGNWLVKFFKKNWRWFAAALLAASLTSCSNETAETRDSREGRAASGKPVVCVVNYPLQYFAERIAGDAVEVVFPAPADVDPADWMPDRKTIKVYQNAELILLNGAGYAKWLDKVSLPASKLVDASAAFKSQLMKVEEVVTHSHGKGGEHSHVGTASHTWLNPRLAVLQAETIRDAFSKRLPDQAASFAANFETLKRDLMELDAELEAVVKSNRDRPVVFSHPIYQYFQRRFAVNSRTLDLMPNTVPDSSELKRHHDLRAKHAYDAVIWNENPGDGQVKELLRIGVKSYVFSPCANVPFEMDYLKAMETNLRNLESVYRANQ